MQTQHNKGNDDYAFAHIAHNTNQIQSNLRTPELIEQCDNYQTTAEGASLPNWAVGSGRHQRWAAPLCSVLERLVSIGPTSCRGSPPSSTRMLVFILLPVVGEFDFASEETIILDLFQRWWSGSLRGRGTVLTVRSGSASTGGKIMSKCAEGYSSSETIIFTSKSECHNNNLDLSITDRAGPGSSVKMETVSRGER